MTRGIEKEQFFINIDDVEFKKLRNKTL